jgi:cytochrome c biogenesis protein CcmG/thiol:disulfide interchange protein DsbE
VLTLGFLTLLKGRDSAVLSGKITGHPAPNVNLPSLNGQIVSLEELRGKPILINFWATWCAPCKEEMPLLESISKEYGSNLRVIVINEGDSLSEVREFIEKEKLNLQVLLDKDKQVGDLYKVGGYPTSVFIDKDGVIQAIFLGELSAEQAESNLHLIGIEK